MNGSPVNRPQILRRTHDGFEITPPSLIARSHPYVTYSLVNRRDRPHARPSVSHAINLGGLNRRGGRADYRFPSRRAGPSSYGRTVSARKSTLCKSHEHVSDGGRLFHPESRQLCSLYFSSASFSALLRRGHATRDTHRRVFGVRVERLLSGRARSHRRPSSYQLHITVRVVSYKKKSPHALSRSR